MFQMKILILIQKNKWTWQESKMSMPFLNFYQLNNQERLNKLIVLKYMASSQSSRVRLMAARNSLRN